MNEQCINTINKDNGWAVIAKMTKSGPATLPLGPKMFLKRWALDAATELNRKMGKDFYEATPIKGDPELEAISDWTLG